MTGKAKPCRSLIIIFRSGVVPVTREMECRVNRIRCGLLIYVAKDIYQAVFFVKHLYNLLLQASDMISFPALRRQVMPCFPAVLIDLYEFEESELLFCGITACIYFKYHIRVLIISFH